MALWSALSPSLVTQAVLHDPAAAQLPTEPFIRSAILGEARGLASGALQQGFNPKSAALVTPYRAAMTQYSTIGILVALLLAFAGGAFAYTRITTGFRARTRVERLVIRKAIEKHGGNISQAARELGYTRSALYRRLEKYGL